MKMQYLSIILCFAYAIPAQCAITEKLNARAAQIAQLKKDIAQGKVLTTASKCKIKSCYIKG